MVLAVYLASVTPAYPMRLVWYPSWGERMPNCPMSTALGHLGRALTIPVRYNINVELKVQRET